jgi:hypothetical protein
MMQSNDDLPPPQQGSPDQGSSSGAAQTGHSVQMGPVQISIPGDKTYGLGGNDVIIGVGVSLVLAAIFWFVGRILTDTLVKQFAEVGSAKRAGLMLFLFLTVLGGFVTFGFLGNFWLANFFFIPAAALSTLLFVIFLFTLISANRSKRR